MIGIIQKSKVVILRDTNAHYPLPPFSPDEKYPEYPFKNGALNDVNTIYSMIRKMFFLYGLDREHFGTAQWNPLGEIIKPHDFVLIKPNLVRHYHPYDLDVQSIFTNGSIIRAVLDYVHIALQGKGNIIIGDAPLQSCDFDEIKTLTGLNEIKEFYKDQMIDINIIDFRLVKAVVDRSSIYGDILKQENLSGDPLGYTQINFGTESFHEPISEYYKKFRVTRYNPSEMQAHHRKGVHEYIIPNTVLRADVVINLPKMKNHHKAGVTGSLKNLIGINGHKDWLPHHRKGSKIKGGDEYLNPSLLKEFRSWVNDKKETSDSFILKKMLQFIQRISYKFPKDLAKDSFSEGSWWGNDTIWRTILDLNRVLLYANKNGDITTSIQRKVFSIIDGIIAGEKDGPLAPTPKKCGILLCGYNPVSVDTVMAYMMGYDWKKIPQIRNAYGLSKYPLASFGPNEIEIVQAEAKDEKLGADLLARMNLFKFQPHNGWVGHIEYNEI